MYLWAELYLCRERERETETWIVRFGYLSSMCTGILFRTWADVWPFPLSVRWVCLQEQPQPTCFWCSWLIVLRSVAISLWVAQPMDRSVSSFKKGMGASAGFRPWQCWAQCRFLKNLFLCCFASALLGIFHLSWIQQWLGYSWMMNPFNSSCRFSADH